jgi:Carboxypeptidase regulatory-like domain
MVDKNHVIALRLVLADADVSGKGELEMPRTFSTVVRRCRQNRFILMLVFCGCAIVRLQGQELYGGVVGVVKDGQGGVLPGAAVVLANRATGLKREAVSNASGAYTFANFPGGQYEVRVSLASFREAVHSSVPVIVGQISRVDVVMQIGGIEEIVEVTSAVQLLQTDKADTRTELKPDEITNLPLNQYRNYQSLLNLVPGSQPGYNAFGETLLPQGTLNIIVGGQDGTQQTTRNDGTNLVNAFLPAAQVYIPPAETIESVNVVTGSMDAESGGASGAAISVTTKSGTNSFRGSAFGFFNSDELNATPYYFGRGAPPRKLPIGRQSLGGTLGGPIRRNQMFFFGASEATSVRGTSSGYTHDAIVSVLQRCGTLTVVDVTLALPKKSVLCILIVYARPLPTPLRSARSRSVRLPVISQSGA